MRNSATGGALHWGWAGYACVGARLILGVVFLYLGLVKAMDPVSFLKLLRQFEVLPSPVALNLVAAILPWFEMLCGALLLSGVALQGTALFVMLMLGGFTAAVFFRAIGIYGTGTLAFCAIRFDCGCGAGDILVCRKLIENLLLCLLAAMVLASGSKRISFKTHPNRRA